jgi:hypothetical protein
MYKVGFLIAKGVEKMKKEKCLEISEAIEILKNNKDIEYKPTNYSNTKKVIHKQLLSEEKMQNLEFM